MPRELTARSFLEIYSLGDLVSAALNHTPTQHPSRKLLHGSREHSGAGAQELYPAPGKACRVHPLKGKEGTRPRHRAAAFLNGVARLHSSSPRNSGQRRGPVAGTAHFMAAGSTRS